MSADFWAGYISGAAGIIIGNPLDLLKTRLQAGTNPNPLVNPSQPSSQSPTSATTTTLQQHPPTNRWRTLLKGSAAPVLGYGALNALLFTTYNRTLLAMHDNSSAPASLGKTFVAGALAGLATFIVSAPTELVKCRVQVSAGHVGSWTAAREIWRGDGFRGLYWGGGVTSVRDSVGYGFYYCSYELSKRALVTSRGDDSPEWMSILLCGGIAGVVTWASIFPLDVVKTRVQTQGVLRGTDGSSAETTALLRRPTSRLGAVAIAGKIYREEGAGVFFRGLGICSARAFVVNAVQWAVYEWIMHILIPKSPSVEAMT